MSSRCPVWLTILALPLLLQPESAAAQVRCSDLSSWTTVFHHICELPHLEEVLVRYPAHNEEWLAARRARNLYLVGGYQFTEACIYLELYPARGADEFWILDGSQAPGASGFPTPLMLLQRDEDTLWIWTPDGGQAPYPAASGHESRLNLMIEKGRLVMTDEGARGDGPERPPRGQPDMAAPQGVYLAVPSFEDTCAGCGPPALSIHLPGASPARWTVSVAEAALRAGNRGQRDVVRTGDDWESIAYRNYRSRSLMLVACAANPRAGVSPRVGAALVIPEPRAVLSSDRLLFRQCEALDFIFLAENLYAMAEPRFWEALKAAPHVARDPGPEGRPALDIDKEDAKLMGEVKRFLDAAADSLAAFGDEKTQAPTHAIGQLRSAAQLAGLLAAGSNDGYGYDLDMIGQHTDLALRNLTIWAQNNFR